MRAGIPEVSVVVPSRGGAARLPLLIDALASQHEPPTFEVCVVVDGDVDGSEGVLRQLRDRHPGLDLRVVVFPQNRGRPAALNVGAERTTGRIIIRCDDDLVPGPSFLRDHVDRHAADQPLGVVGLYRNIFPPTPFAQVYGEVNDRLFREQAYEMPPDRRWQYWAGNVSLRRETWNRVGPYDARFRRYGWEDVDYGFRLHQVGIPVVLAPELETEHRAAATTTESRTRRALHAGASSQIFLAKHGAEALGGPIRRNGIWGVAVGVLARFLTEENLRIVGHTTDLILNYLPRWVGEKLVAIQIQAASDAGRRHPELALTLF